MTFCLIYKKRNIGNYIFLILVNTHKRKEMKHLSLTLFLVTLSLIGTSYTKFCSPVHTLFDKLLTRFDPQFNTAVEGYFVSDNIFKVTYSYDPTIEIGSEKKVFEYGPFGSSCEMYEMGSSVNANLIGAKNIRLLFLYKDRSKNGKLVTPIFHGEGVSVLNHKIITFDHYISLDKAPYTQKYRLSAALVSVRNVIQQKNSKIPLKWKSKLIK